jgi:hypothetical protein
MRRVVLAEKGAVKDPAVRAALQQIETASAQNDTMTIANNFKITNPPATPLRTIDGTSGTLAQLLQFVTTLVADLQKGGANRST